MEDGGYDDDAPLLSGGGMLLLVVVGIVSVVVGVGVGVEVGGGVVGLGVDVGIGTSVGFGGGGAGSSLLLGSSPDSEGVVGSCEALDELGSGGGTAGRSDEEAGVDSLVELDVFVTDSSVGTGNRVADSLPGVWVP